MTSTLNDFETFILEYCKDSPLHAGLDTRLSELGLDSLDLLDLVLAIENQFNIEIDMEGVDDEMSLREFGTRFLK
jgi:acyl carrier protein